MSRKKCNTSYLKNSYKNVYGDIKVKFDWYDYFLNTAIELAINRFTWVNLPPEIDPRYLEMSITLGGSCVFFHDFVKGFCALRGAYSGINDYNNPTDFKIITPTGFSPHVYSDEAVVIWNNYTRTSDYPVIDLFATTLADMYQSALVNTRGQKHPIVAVVYDDAQRLTLENQYAQLDGNHPILYLKGGDGFTQPFTTIDATVPFVAPEIFNMVKGIWEDLLKWLGIVIANTDKKERQIKGELYTYNAVVYQLRNRGLQARQNACNAINNMFGLNMDVLFNENISDFIPDMMMEEKNE